MGGTAMNLWQWCVVYEVKDGGLLILSSTAPLYGLEPMAVVRLYSDVLKQP